jgi:tetratricopeptide (TPR) repeat protein
LSTTSRCADPAILAAFVEGRLDPESRAAVERHLAECLECPLVVGQTVRFLQELQADERDVDAIRRSNRKWLALAASIATVSIILVLIWQPDDPIDEIRDVAARAPSRTLEGRLNGFAYARLSGTRSASSPEIDLALRAVRERLEERPGPASMHARGVALLLEGDTATAMRLLATVAAAGDDATAWNDLAVAQLALDVPQEALRSADRAIALSPTLAAAHFNRAVALERANRPAEAIRAYAEALRHEPLSSPWRGEIDARIADLTAH